MVLERQKSIKPLQSQINRHAIPSISLEQIILSYYLPSQSEPFYGMITPLFPEEYSRSQEDTSMHPQPITHAALSPTALRTVINNYEGIS